MVSRGEPTPGCPGVSRGSSCARTWRRGEPSAEVRSGAFTSTPGSHRPPEVDGGDQGPPPWRSDGGDMEVMEVSGPGGAYRAPWPFPTLSTYFDRTRSAEARWNVTSAAPE